MTEILWPESNSAKGIHTHTTQTLRHPLTHTQAHTRGHTYTTVERKTCVCMVPTSLFWSVCVYVCVCVRFLPACFGVRVCVYGFYQPVLDSVCVCRVPTGMYQKERECVCV